MQFRKIFIFCLIFIMCITREVYGKYYYVYEYNVADFTREISKLSCSVSYSQTEWTNQDVTIFITSNNELEPVSNFVLSEDKKTLSKTVSQNEAGNVKVYDLSGNSEEVYYSVENIDKNPPEIIGCENGGSYTLPLNLDYADDNEIKDIYVDEYDNTLYFRYIYFYQDSSYYYGIDRTKSTVRIDIRKHPLNTRKYIMYLDGNYYATTTENIFVYTGLEKGHNYNIKVEAIDENGNKLAEASADARTSYYEELTSQKDDKTFTCTFKGVEDIGYIKFILWSNSNEGLKYCYDVYARNDEISFSFNKFSGVSNTAYTIHAYVYDPNGNYVDIVGIAMDFKPDKYVPKNYQYDPYCLTDAGNYQIIVTDVAGNETEYCIEIRS